MATPEQILQAGMDSALSGLNTLGDGRLALAQHQLSRAEQLADENRRLAAQRTLRGEDWVHSDQVRKEGYDRSDRVRKEGYERDDKNWTRRLDREDALFRRALAAEAAKEGAQVTPDMTFDQIARAGRLQLEANLRMKSLQALQDEAAAYKIDPDQPREAIAAQLLDAKSRRAVDQAMKQANALHASSVLMATGREMRDGETPEQYVPRARAEEDDDAYKQHGLALKALEQDEAATRDRIAALSSYVPPALEKKAILALIDSGQMAKYISAGGLQKLIKTPTHATLMDALRVDNIGNFASGRADNTAKVTTQYAALLAPDLRAYHDEELNIENANLGLIRQQKRDAQRAQSMYQVKKGVSNGTGGPVFQPQMPAALRGPDDTFRMPGVARIPALPPTAAASTGTPGNRPVTATPAALRDPYPYNPQFPLWSGSAPTESQKVSQPSAIQVPTISPAFRDRLATPAAFVDLDNPSAPQPTRRLIPLDERFDAPINSNQGLGPWLGDHLIRHHEQGSPTYQRENRLNFIRKTHPNAKLVTKGGDKILTFEGERVTPIEYFVDLGDTPTPTPAALLSPE